MKQRERIQNELEEIAPSMAKMDKTEPFKTPQDYFEQFPDQMRLKINGQSQYLPQDNTLIQTIEQYLEILLKPTYAAALSALFLFLLTGGYALYLDQPQSPSFQQEFNISNLSNQEVSAYVANNIDQFNVTVIVEDGNWQNDDRTQNANFTIEKLNNQELDQYIMANIDQETIQNEMQ